MVGFKLKFLFPKILLKTSRGLFAASICNKLENQQTTFAIREYQEKICILTRYIPKHLPLTSGIVWCSWE